MSKTQRSCKRPFRPDISSYFDNLGCDVESLPKAPQSLVPNLVLPTTIQSSLLNVGMRVRKSVPEGYKTSPKPFYRPSMSYSDIPSKLNNTAAFESTDPCHTRNASDRFCDLTPFSGIRKVGGLEVQPVPSEDELPPLQFELYDRNLPSSQESYTSVICTDSINLFTSSSVCRNKRRREDADEEESDLNLQPISPRSRPISHTRMPNLDQLRPIALPMTRQKSLHAPEMIESEMLDVEDFEEADFLGADECRHGRMQVQDI